MPHRAVTDQTGILLRIVESFREFPADLLSGSVFHKLVSGAVNHLLQQEKWAQNQLRPFVGESVFFEFRSYRLGLRMTSSGLLEPCDGTTHSVLVRLPEEAMAMLAADRTSLLAKVKISGTVDFAETLSFVFKHLRWDAESDLAHFFGDIAARRLMRTGQQIFATQRQKLQHLSQNVLAYLTREDVFLLEKEDFNALRLQIVQLTQEVDCLESRLRSVELKV